MSSALLLQPRPSIILESDTELAFRLVNMPPAPANQQSAAKRQKPNIGSALRKPAAPNVNEGIRYWEDVEASVDGVLGGYGRGPVPHIEQLSSRLLLLSLLPSLHTFASPLTPTPSGRPAHRLTALDVGAGIGRVTRHVLLPLFEDVVLLEPVDKFVREAYRSAGSGEWRDLPKLGKQPSSDGSDMEKYKEDERKVDEAKEGRGKRVWCVKGPLQGFDPAFPLEGERFESVGVIGTARAGSGADLGEEEEEVVYDVIWCQWCLGHMTHTDLVAFLRKARTRLRESDQITDEQEGYTSLIFVKENACDDAAWGEGHEFLDPEDSSLTRSNARWLEIFEEAGLKVIKEEVQQGMPSELFTVKTWAMR